MSVATYAGLSMATILVTGGSGFIGGHFCRKATDLGWNVIVLTRKTIAAAKKLPSTVHCIERLSELDTQQPIDIILNLAGKPLAESRWTAARKQSFVDSRVHTTNQLYQYFSALEIKPRVMISGSAVGYYGSNNNLLDETGASGDDFSARLCFDWEASAKQFEGLGCRVCYLRTGIVLGEQGALAKMLPAFKLALGGPIGDGRQWMSWIHIEDMVSLILYCINSDNLAGPVNAAAPNPVTNRVFSKTLGAALHRPAIFAMPAPVVRLLFGEMGEALLLQGQAVVPKKLQDSGFEFTYPQLGEALRQLIGRNG
jgi:uncharacterized protein (TIGR01777 family)